MGALAEVTAELSAFTGRAAGTDAERRAAAWLHADLRTRGHAALVQTVWVRPQWAWSLAAHAALGVATSLVALTEPVVALVLAAVALVSYGLELAGGGGLLLRLLPRRATQVVVVEPPAPAAVALWVTAATDVSRRGLLRCDGRHRRGWVLAALAGVTALAAARVDGADAGWLGVLALPPTLLLLLAAGLAADVALSAPSAGGPEAAAVAVALALHDELLEAGPAGLSPGLVLAGAGELPPLGLAAWLRGRRPDPARSVLLELGPCGAGGPVWASRQVQLVRAFAPVGRRVRARTRRRRPAVALRTAREAPADEAAAEAVYHAALDGLERLELAPPQASPARSRAKATNQS